nr:hypothetical protein CoNPh38_CDS0245 [Staphylococcus phage S-CoN_Ph38]
MNHMFNSLKTIIIQVQYIIHSMRISVVDWLILLIVIIGNSKINL